MAVNSADVTAIADYAGRYERKLFHTLYNALDALQDLTTIPNVKNKLQMTKLKVNNGPKPYTGVHKAAAGDLEYTGRTLEVDRSQRDITIDFDVYRQTWMQNEMGPGSNPNNKRIPFAEYVWQQVFGQLAADINDRVIYHGLDKGDFAAFAGGSTYTAGDLVTFVVDSETKYWKCVTNTSAGESPATHPAKWQDVTVEATAEGLGSLVAKAIVAGKSPVTIGVIDNSNVYAYAAFKELFRSQSDAYKKYGVNMYCSFTDAELLIDDLEDKVTKFTRADVTQGGSMNFPLPGTFGKANVVPCSWMAGSRRILVTPKENLLLGTDRTSDMNTVGTVPTVYGMDAGISYLLGLQIRDLDALVINDQA